MMTANPTANLSNLTAWQALTPNSLRTILDRAPWAHVAVFARLVDHPGASADDLELVVLNGAAHLRERAAARLVDAADVSTAQLRLVIGHVPRVRTAAARALVAHFAAAAADLRYLVHWAPDVRDEAARLLLRDVHGTAADRRFVESRGVSVDAPSWDVRTAMRGFPAVRRTEALTPLVARAA